MRHPTSYGSGDLHRRAEESLRGPFEERRTGPNVTPFFFFISAEWVYGVLTARRADTSSRHRALYVIYIFHFIASHHFETNKQKKANEKNTTVLLSRHDMLMPQRISFDVHYHVSLSLFVFGVSAPKSSCCSTSRAPKIDRPPNPPIFFFSLPVLSISIPILSIAIHYTRIHTHTPACLYLSIREMTAAPAPVCVDAEEKWYEADDIGGAPIRFRMVEEDESTGDVEPWDAVEYLLQLLSHIEDGDDDDESILRAAHHLYRDVMVQVIPLGPGKPLVEGEDEDEDEGEDEEQSCTDDDGAPLTDVWSPMTLMLTLQRWDMIERTLRFHRSKAVEVLQRILRAHRVGALAWFRCRVPEEETALPTMLLLPTGASEAESQSVTVGCGEAELSLEHVLTGLKPLIDYVVLRQGGSHSMPDDGTQFLSRMPKPLTALLERLAATDTDGAAVHHRDGLVLGVRALFESCPVGAYHHMRELLQHLFHGMLLPVSFTSVGEGELDALAPSVWLPYTPQDVQKLFMLAFWMNSRAEFLLERRIKPEEPAVPESPLSPRGHRPVLAIHRDELVLLTALLSPRCDAEAWGALLESYPARFELPAPGTHHHHQRLPAAITLLLVAGVMFAEAAHFRWDGGTLAQVVKKVEALLTSGPVQAQLHRFLLSSPSTQTENFQELWLGLTLFHGCHKFQSRVEQLYCGVVDSVLAAVEGRAPPKARSQTPTPPPLSPSTPHWELLLRWLRLWKGFLETLATENASMCGGTSDSAAANAADATTAAQDMVSLMGRLPAAGAPGMKEDEGQIPDDVAEAQGIREVLELLLEALPERLRGGRPPLPALHAALFGGGGGEGPTTLEEQFERAQQGFGRRAARESDATKLKFYGLYKQATVGDVNIPKPWVMDRVGRAKWGAWEALKGLAREEAKKQYVDAFRALP
eukprot:gene11981-8254_t